MTKPMSDRPSDYSGGQRLRRHAELAVITAAVRWASSSRQPMEFGTKGRNAALLRKAVAELRRWAHHDSGFRPVTPGLDDG